MKIGPNQFPTTFSGGPVLLTIVPGQQGPSPFPSAGTYTQVFGMTVIATSMTGLPIECRGLYDKTFQLSATQSANISTITTVLVEASIDPSAVPSPTQVTWYPVATLTASNNLGTHAGIVRAIRARTTAVSNTDSFIVVWMGDDRG